MKQAVLGYKGNRAWTLVLLISVALIPASGFGQIISGDLVGTVYDASGQSSPTLPSWRSMKPPTSRQPLAQILVANIVLRICW